MEFIEEPIIATLSINDFASKLNLKVVYDTHTEITLTTDSILRPGLQLTGYVDYFANDRVQVIGQAEYTYFETLTEDVKRERLEKIFSIGFPCLIVSRDLPVDPLFIEIGTKYNIPIFLSQNATVDLVTDITNYLSDLLAPRTQLHGVLVDILGVGVLIMGNSGVGKSEAALELIKRGHRLCSDDVVAAKRIKQDIIGTSPSLIRHFMEVRGIGIIDIGMMYGAGAVKLEQPIELVIHLEKWDDAKEYERVGDKIVNFDILGVKIPRLVIPVSPGRNVAIILETAAANLRLNRLGYNAADELSRRTMSLFTKNN